MQDPQNFIKDLTVRAARKNARLALPEGDDPRVIEATGLLLKGGAPKEIHLFGNVSGIQKALAAAKISDPKVRIVDSNDAGLRAATAKHFQERAEAKGKAIDPKELRTLGDSVLNQAAYYLASDRVDAVVGGCAHTTADVIRASLRGAGMKKGIRTLSGCFVMVKAEQRFLFSDCGVVADPTAEQIVDIAEATADTFTQIFGAEGPKVAFLSFSTKGSAEHPRVKKMSDAAAAFKERCPKILSDGELQFDAAFVPDVARRKAPDSPVEGAANCFIFPDLDAGNISYKIAQRLGAFEAYGPILQGSAKPYLDLSRGADAKDIMASSLLAILRSKPEA